MAKLYFYYSAMNAGKSTILLQSNFNYQERGMKTLLYAPVIDTRSGVGRISSRLGIFAGAKVIDSSLSLYEDISQSLKLDPKIRCVLVDEAHFLKKQHVFELCKVVDELDLPVLCYGLRSDFRGEPFEGSLYLLTLADNLVETKTICHCGKKATMSMRVSNGKRIAHGEQIQIGGNEMYVSACRKHFLDGDIGEFIKPTKT